jgi:hypothetical protein
MTAIITGPVWLASAGDSGASAGLSLSLPHWQAEPPLQDVTRIPRQALTAAWNTGGAQASSSQVITEGGGGGEDGGGRVLRGGGQRR